MSAYDPKRTFRSGAFYNGLYVGTDRGLGCRRCARDHLGRRDLLLFLGTNAAVVLLAATARQIGCAPRISLG